MSLKPIYIKNSFCISAQDCTNDGFLNPVILPENNKYTISEPNYTELIPQLELRRLSKILKASIYAALNCLSQANLEKVDGIIFGTARGNLTDIEKFVKNIFEYEEENLNPTPFIFSTYNAIIGAVALKTQSLGYNQTIVHGGSSLELSLYDTQLEMHFKKHRQLFLVGCFDQLTDDYYKIKNKIGYWKKNKDNKLLSLQNHSEGIMGGEGAAFFICSNEAQDAVLEIEKISTHDQLSATEIWNTMNRLLNEISWKIEDVDLFVLGLNGNTLDNESYFNILNHADAKIPVLAFKHLSGEYETAGGFGIHLLIQVLQNKDLPDTIWYRKPKNTQSFKKIIYYNHFKNRQQNFMFLTKTMNLS